MLVLFSAPVQALPSTTLEFKQASFSGQQETSAQASALRISSSQQLDVASIEGEASALRVTTHNLTSPVVAQVGVNPDRGGATREFQTARIFAAPSFTDVDLFITKLADAPAPRLTSTSASLVAAAPEQQRVTETAYVDSTRPVASQDVSNLLAFESRGTTNLRLEGSFAISFWSWNFTIATAQGEAPIVTGYYRHDAVKDPVTNTDLAWTGFSQVAQVEVRDGWLEIRDAHAATQVSYAPLADITGSGTATVEGATGTLAGVTAQDARLDASGQFQWTAHRNPALTLEITRLYGDASIDGQVLDLGDSGPIRSQTVVRNDAVKAWSMGAGIIALFLVVILVKGPAMTGRFNRIQHRFDAKDYRSVLARIDPFTRRPKFRRRAVFVKAISLLSLQEYREAQLYLQTLGPAESPEPATKAFLMACASAGLGQESATIKHLSDCFQDDPSYMEEAKDVPVLAGYLPYFSITPPGEAAT